MPLRRCVACRRSLPREELTRLYRAADGTWQLDRSRGSTGGRGAWVCQAEQCRDAAALGRFFRRHAARIAEELRTAPAGGQASGGTNV